MLHEFLIVGMWGVHLKFAKNALTSVSLIVLPTNQTWWVPPALKKLWGGSVQSSHVFQLLSSNCWLPLQECLPVLVSSAHSILLLSKVYEIMTKCRAVLGLREHTRPRSLECSAERHVKTWGFRSRHTQSLLMYKKQCVQRSVCGTWH